MAVTGIVNGYNMYRNPYYAGSMSGAAAREAATGTSGMTQDAVKAGAAGLTGDKGNVAGADGVQNAAGVPGKPRDTAGIPEAMQNAAGLPKSMWDAVFGRGKETSREDAANPDAHKKAGRKSSPEECQTCKERKYQDGSDENVSFKAAAHISPESAGARVRAHEGEHVSNAYKEAAENGGKVINASVMIHTAICPECGRTYVSGGTTSTTIRYSKEENPYKKAQKTQEAIRLRGKNIDYAA